MAEQPVLFIKDGRKGYQRGVNLDPEKQAELIQALAADQAWFLVQNALGEGEFIHLRRFDRVVFKQS